MSRWGNGSHTVPNCNGPGVAGIEDTACDVDMRNRIAIEQYLPLAEIVEESKNRDAGRKLRQESGFRSQPRLPGALIPDG